MATVQVNSLEEFVAAIAVAGDTVVCPEGADWDANDTYPDGYSGDIPWNASVRGNGTTIRNLHIYGFFSANSSSFPKIYSLHIKDLIGSRSTGTSLNAGLFDGNFYLEDSALSAVLNSSYFRIIRPGSDAAIAKRCAFTVDASGSFQGFYLGSVWYTRCEIHAPNASQSFSFATRFYQSELAIYAPNMDEIDSYRYQGCIIHGEMANVRDSSSNRGNGDITLFSTDGMPNFVPYDPTHFKGVTDAQLRDPEYLRSIGFPIAIGG